jgi:hypothetical protein
VAIHNSGEVKGNLPEFKKGSKVTFILDLTGDGTLSACSLWMAPPFTSYSRACFPKSEFWILKEESWSLE